MIANTDVCRELEDHPEKIEFFFRTKHPGIIPDLLSVQSATDQFVSNQHISLKSIKCGKFGYEDSGVLMGDASHTMTPFHAMGMITGLEDVRIFFEEFIDPAHRGPLYNGKSGKPFCPRGIVHRYTEHRRPDVQAITDMSEEHYHELRLGFRSQANQFRKLIESTLQKYIPSLDWATLYWRIQFSHERLSVVRQKEDRQKKLMKSFITWLLLVCLLATVVFLARCYYSAGAGLWKKN